MALDPFEAPLVKLARGRKHIDNLRIEIGAYVARQPIYRNAWSDEMPGYIAGEVVVAEPVPHEFAAILGDAIHNMRVSLDLLAHDLVRLEGGNTNGVYFPFAENPNDFDLAIRKRNFHRASPEAVQLVKQLQPFSGGNSRLRGLHDLDIRDKHQMVIPAIGHVRYPSGGVGLPGLASTTGTVSKHLFLASAYGPEASITGKKLPVVFDLIFPLHGPFDGAPVVPTLHDLADHLFGIVEAFAALYGRQISK